MSNYEAKFGRETTGDYARDKPVAYEHGKKAGTKVSRLLRKLGKKLVETADKLEKGKT